MKTAPIGCFGRHTRHSSRPLHSSSSCSSSSSSSSSSSGYLWSRHSSSSIPRSFKLAASATDGTVSASSSSEGSSSSGGRFDRLIQQRQDGTSERSKGSKQFKSSWDAKEAGGGRGGGADYLYEIGASANYNTNVDVGQNIDMIDSLFAGKTLGHKTDIADGSLRAWEFRTYNNIVGDYYVAPAFLEKVAMHMAKNYLADQDAIPKSTKVPLILGVWGPKGCGKTFQTELAFKQMGVEAVVMSAGELESEVAGQPGRLLRERYRKAAELSRVRGKLSALMINDLDAGIGRFGNTQCTVNNQIVVGTLMNICDNPNQVSVHENWREGDYNQRVPIIVTGNDFATLYAPLIRDGRMEKYYWEPTTEDVVAIVHQMYKDDGLSSDDIHTLVTTFRGQSLDFFGAVRASTYDWQIREWMVDVSGSSSLDAEDANFKEVNRRLINKEGLPVFEPVAITVQDLLAEGRRLVAEQDAVNAAKLSEEYMRGAKRDGKPRPSLLGLMG